MQLAQIDFDKIKVPQASSAAFAIDSNLTLGTIISNLLPYIFALAGILLLAYLLYGGFHYMTSRGEPKGVQEARAKITYALIGFVIVFTAYWLVQVAGSILGLPGIGEVFKNG